MPCNQHLRSGIQPTHMPLAFWKPASLLNCYRQSRSYNACIVKQLRYSYICFWHIFVIIIFIYKLFYWGKNLVTLFADATDYNKHFRLENIYYITYTFGYISYNRDRAEAGARSYR